MKREKKEGPSATIGGDVKKKDIPERTIHPGKGRSNASWLGRKVHEMTFNPGGEIRVVTDRFDGGREAHFLGAEEKGVLGKKDQDFYFKK